jgi:hypothetical protein
MNIFLPLPAPADNGAGAAVDMTAFGSVKTITVANLAGARIQVEISNDDNGVNFTPVGKGFQKVGEQTLEVGCHWMRAVVSHYQGGGAPVVAVGGTDDGTLFAELHVPAGNGVGASADVSTLGLFKTVQVSGTFTGMLAIEVSEDAGVTFATAFSFSSGGEETRVIAASAMRVKRAGSGNAPGSPVVNIAAVVTDACGSSDASSPFNVATFTIYARTTGSNTEGHGKSPATAYRTLERAVRDVPEFIPPGVTYIVDVTGITEVLPPDYVLPSWKSSETVRALIGDKYFNFRGAVNIEAIPQLVAAIPPADAVIAATDILSQVAAPVTGLVMITVAPRGSWGVNGLKGKLVVGNTGGPENAVITANTTTTLSLATTAVPTPPIQIMEPSASISGTSTVTVPTVAPRGCLNAINCDSIAFNGLKITTPTVGGNGLAIDGAGEAIVQLCELQSPVVFSHAMIITRMVRNWIRGKAQWGGIITWQQSLLDACTTFELFTPLQASFRRCVVDACPPLEAVTLMPGAASFGGSAIGLLFQNTLVCNTPGTLGDGIRFHGARGRLSSVDIYNCGRDGVRMDGGNGFIELLNVGTTGPINAGIGIHVPNDGGVVKVDGATSSAAAAIQLRGAGGDMRIGSLGPRTWADFIAAVPASGHPQFNEYDLTAASAAGATGTGCRLYQ